MRYIKASNVRKKLKEAGYQITGTALVMIDVKVDAFLESLMKVWNGHHKRITPELVNLLRLK